MLTEEMHNDIDSIEQDIRRLRDDLVLHIRTRRLRITDKLGNMRNQWDVFNGMCSLTLCSKNQVVGVWLESLGRGSEGMHLFGKKNARLEFIYRTDVNISVLLMDHYKSRSHIGFRIQSNGHEAVNIYIGKKAPINYHSVNMTINKDCGASLIIQMRNLKKSL